MAKIPNPPPSRGGPDIVKPEPPLPPPPKIYPESQLFNWTCLNCHCRNHVSRARCRGCGCYINDFNRQSGLDYEQ
jgi:hypothetical protein